MRYFLLAALLSVTGCLLQTENSNSGDAALANASLEFAVVQEIFLSKCTSCHRHDFHTMSEAELVATGQVVAGDIDNSKIYYRCIGSSSPLGPKNMPTVGAPLTSTELEAMEDWINSLTP